ncbi:hypothetical protein ACFWN1_04030 [Streptomyces sp. NPDC058459]|uniref:hypothetical protein n=1 Tax=Streptomyces sp. NPDC058459 TaxID=3346508 RepID=UPI00364FA37E
MNRPTYVVLGASGRLGRHLLPLLPDPERVVALSRRHHDSARTTWLVTDLSEGPCSVSPLVDRLRDAESVTLVDLVLDRRSVATMRRSLATSTKFTIAVRHCLHAARVPARIVVASSTAVLAPIGLRTPYGIAKRRQAGVYGREVGVDLVLLPQLGGLTPYEAAAAHLAGVMAMPSPADRRLWLVPTPPPTDGPHIGLGAAAQLSLLAWTTRRSDPAAARHASHVRLDQLPPRLRARLDHHTAPPFLRRRFERDLGLAPARLLTSEDICEAP